MSPFRGSAAPVATRSSLGIASSLLCPSGMPRRQLIITDRGFSFIRCPILYGLRPANDIALRNVGPVPRPLAYSQRSSAGLRLHGYDWSTARRSKFTDRRWGAKTFGKVSLWTCESRALFQGWMITRWSILYRFYPQTSACSIRPRRQIKAAGPSIQLFDRNPSGCPLPSLRNLSSERKSSCKCLQCCKENR
jgi:hypothetical protein